MEFFQGVIVTPTVECLVVAMTDVYGYDEIGILAYVFHHGFCLLHNLLPWTEDVLQLSFGLTEIPRVVHRKPTLLEAKTLEDSVPDLVMGHFPREPLVVVPTVTTFQIPFMP